MAEEEQDRSETATPYKLQEAQKRGQTAKSQDAAVAAIVAAFVGGLYAVGPGVVRQGLQLSQAVFTQAGREDWSVSGVAGWTGELLLLTAQVILPVLLAVAGAAILVNFAQTGAIFSAHPIQPDFDRVNPASGLKRLFSLRLLYDTGKSVVKLLVLSIVFWLVMVDLLPQLAALPNLGARGQAKVLVDDLLGLLAKLLLVLLIIGVIDYAYTRWEFAKKMRMSKREVKDEHKQREGDPKIRARIRELRLEMLKQARSVRRLPEADVLITNPTHIAVALAYKHGEMLAPQLLTKGADELAAKLRLAARKHNIPIVENPPLARELYKRLDYNGIVPEDLYPQVAKILVWVYTMREQRAQATQSATAGGAQ